MAVPRGDEEGGQGVTRPRLQGRVRARPRHRPVPRVPGPPLTDPQREPAAREALPVAPFTLHYALTRRQRAADLFPWLPALAGSIGFGIGVLVLAVDVSP